MFFTSSVLFFVGFFPSQKINHIHSVLSIILCLTYQSNICLLNNHFRDSLNIGHWPLQIQSRFTNWVKHSKTLFISLKVWTFECKFGKHFYKKRQHYYEPTGCSLIHAMLILWASSCPEKNSLNLFTDNHHLFKWTPSQVHCQSSFVSERSITNK